MKIFLPVIHVENTDQALRNAVLARDCGANGVFLINHSIRHSKLMEVYDKVRATMGKWWIGINSLGITPVTLFSLIPLDISGVWIDNACIDENSIKQPDAEAILAARRKFRGLLFGGVAFKYQAEVHDVAQTAKIATKYVDIVTTSGPATGSPASVEKVQKMKAAMGNKSLAIASGITPENVDNYLEYVDFFLVATGISYSETELDAGKTASLAAMLNR